MSNAAEVSTSLQRPDFMVVLGLLPPYVLEDVREAYRQRVLTAHPDRGGDAADFNRLSEAYDRAVDYVTFLGDRRTWIATQVESHLLQEEVAAEVRRRGGQVEFERLDWVKDSWGDGFELLADRLRSIRVHNQPDGDALLAFLGEKRLSYLTELDLSGSRVTDASLHHLAGCTILQWLDLSNTSVTYSGLRSALQHLPSLRQLNVKGTSLGWFRRRLLMYWFPQVSVVAQAPGLPDSYQRMPIYIP